MFIRVTNENVRVIFVVKIPNNVSTLFRKFTASSFYGVVSKIIIDPFLNTLRTFGRERKLERNLLTILKVVDKIVSTQFDNNLKYNDENICFFKFELGTFLRNNNVVSGIFQRIISLLISIFLRINVVSL